MKEAAELLDCMEIDEGKLSAIYEELPLDLLNNEKLMHLIKKLNEMGILEGDDVKFEDFFKLMNDENLIPAVNQILLELVKDEKIANKIEKDILPILFSK